MLMEKAWVLDKLCSGPSYSLLDVSSMLTTQQHIHTYLKPLNRNIFNTSISTNWLMKM